MSDKKFQTIIDCGFSKIRAGTFNEEGANKPFFIESNFYTDKSNFRLEIKKTWRNEIKERFYFIFNSRSKAANKKILFRL